MDLNRQTSSTEITLQRSALEAGLEPRAPDCRALAALHPLATARHSGAGMATHGPTRRVEASPAFAERQWIEPATRQRRRLTDIALEEARPDEAQAPFSASPDRGPNQPLLYLSSACSLTRQALEHQIAQAISALQVQLAEQHARPAQAAIIFYYCWQHEVAMLDVALPAEHALERRPVGSVRGGLLPESSLCVRPRGGLRGLATARRLLAARCHTTASDPLFRVWQEVPLMDGTLPADWLDMPLHTGQHLAHN